MKVILFFCAAGFLISCGQSDLDKRVADLEAKVAKCEDQKISPETAILIAKGYMFLDYDLKNDNIETTEYPESWRVQFDSKCQNCDGGNPHVLIDKKTGQVLQILPAK